MYIFDVEIYRNYALVVFHDRKTGQYHAVDKWNDQWLTPPLKTLPDTTLVGFNSQVYDLPMITGILKGWPNQKLKDISNDIIRNGLLWWEFERKYGCDFPQVDHIDIFPILPLKASLKIYGGRIGSRKLQELPIDPEAEIQEHQIPILRRYCINDCRVTAELYKKIEPQIELRKTLGKVYNVDLRSKSDAQIAEAVIAKEYERRTGNQLTKPKESLWYPNAKVRYTPPSFIQFERPELNKRLEDIKKIEFVISKSGSIELPKKLTGIEFCLGLLRTKYAIGIGGLHSKDRPGSFYANKGCVLQDIDVTSYYPSIILNAGYFPSHIGFVFLDIYRDLVNRRLKAKAEGNKVTADTLKITINGTFGKLGNKYSKVYAPDLMLHVTLTGQLCLLMLIEQLGDRVISANTDGLLVKYERYDEPWVKAKVADWERKTNFNMEWKPYRSFHRRDVNNYIGITPDGTVKTKGIFAPSNLSKNPVNPIVIDAVSELLLNGVSLEDTIYNCKDPAKFLTLRTVKGGAVKDNMPLGKSVRWYYSKKSNTAIHYITNGNKVPKSDDSEVLQDIPDRLPDDIDYRRYLKEAKDLLGEIHA